MRSAKRSADLSTELQASGYVAQFLVTNDNPAILVLTNEQVAPPYWSYLVESNVAAVTCRSSDAPRIRAALEQKP